MPCGQVQSPGPGLRTHVGKGILLTAGKNEVNFFLFLSRAARARKVNPKNVNDMCPCEPRRLPSLQYPIRVLAGCSRSPTCSMRLPIAARTSSAWPQVAHADGVVGVPLELDARVLPGEPGIERVVHEQVRQHGKPSHPAVIPRPSPTSSHPR